MDEKELIVNTAKDLLIAAMQSEGDRLDFNVTKGDPLLEVLGNRFRTLLTQVASSVRSLKD